MNGSDFYYNWMICGIVFGSFGAGITIYIYAKMKGAENVNWKHCSIALLIFLGPGAILPFLLDPIMPLPKRIGVVVVVLLFCAIRYYATTKGQKAMAELRESKKKDKQ